MKKILKWTLILILLMLLVLVGAFVFINNPIIKQPLLNKISESVGRPVHLEGPIHITWGDPWQFALKDLSIDNAAWANSPHALKVESFHVDIDTSLLLSGQLAIEEVTLIKPQIWLEQKDGQSNWQFDTQQGEQSDDNGQSETGHYPDWLLLKNISIENADVYFYQQGAPQHIAFQSIDFTQNKKTASLEILASMQEKALTLSGKTMALPIMINEQKTSDFTLAIVHDKKDKLDLNGTLKLAEQPQVDANMNLDIEDLSNFSEIAGVTLPAIKQLQGQARFHNQAKQPQAQNSDTQSANQSVIYGISDIQVDGLSQGLKLNINGEIENVAQQSGVDLNLAVSGVTNAKNLLHSLENDFQLNADIKANLSSDQKGLLLDIDKASLNSDIADAFVSKNKVRLNEDWQQPLSIELRIDDTQQFANTMDIDLPPLKAVKLIASIMRKDEAFALEAFEITSQENHLSATTSGNLKYKEQQWVGSEDVTINVDAFVLNHWLEGLSDAGLEKLTLTAKLMGQKDHLAFDDLLLISNASAQSKANSAISNEPILKAQGRWGNLQYLGSLDLDAKVMLPYLSDLSTISQTQLPKTGPVVLTTKITGNNKEVLNLKAIDLSIKNDDVGIEITGQYDDVLAESRKLSLTASSEFRDAKVFDVFLQKQQDKANHSITTTSDNDLNGTQDAANANHWLNVFMPINANFNLAFAQESLRIEELDVQSDAYGLSTRISGGVDSSKPWQGSINVVSNGRLNVDALEKTVDVKQLPEMLSGKVDLNAQLIAKEGVWGLEQAQLEIDSAHTKLNAKGRIPSFTPLASEDFVFNLTSDDLLKVIGKNTTFKANQSVDLKLHLHGNDNPTEKQSMDVDIKVGDSNLNGNLNWQNQTNGYAVRSKLNSSLIDLDSLLSKQKDDKKDKPKAAKNLFTTDAFDLSWMQKLDIDFTANIDKLIGAILTLQDIEAAATVKNGVLEHNINALTQKGTLKSSLLLEDKQGKLATHFKLNGDNIETAAITQLELKEIINDSSLNFRVNLAGQGQSTQELMGDLDGVVQLELDEAVFNNSLLDWVGGDIISGLVDAINPIKREADKINLQCASLYLRVNDGQINEKDFIGIKTDKVTMLGDAKIDLGSEDMELYFIPRANKGLGISASTVAKMVRIGGTFMQPKLETDAEGLLKSGAAVGLAVASGGWSLVAQGLLDRFESSQDICERVIKENADDEPVTEYKREVVKEVGDKKLVRVQVPDDSPNDSNDKSSQDSQNDKNNPLKQDTTSNEGANKADAENNKNYEVVDPASER